MIDYLYACGHRRIGVLGGNLSGEQISSQRLRGVYAAMARNGLDFDPARGSTSPAATPWRRATGRPGACWSGSRA